MRDLTTGQPYKIELGGDNRVLPLTYQINHDALLNITRIDPGFRAVKIAIPYDRKEGKLGGVIENNLYDSLGDDGESPLLGCALSDIFSWDIDFTTDLRKGDTFKVVVEELWLGGRFINPLGVNVPRGGGIPKPFIADYDRNRHTLGLVLASIVPVPREPGPESGERTIASSR